MPSDLADILAGLDRLNRSIDSFHRDTREISNGHLRLAERLASLEGKIESLAEDTQLISTIVRDGNGQPSLLHRTAMIETQLSSISLLLTSRNGDVTGTAEYKGAVSLSKAQVWSAIIGLVGAFLATAVASWAAK